MFISRYDKRTIPWKRTKGLYGHLPKFYKCRGPLEDFGDEFQPCSKPTWHLNYEGYFRIITKWGTGTFWYYGVPYKHKRLEWHGVSPTQRP